MRCAVLPYTVRHRPTVTVTVTVTVAAVLQLPSQLLLCAIRAHNSLPVPLPVSLPLPPTVHPCRDILSTPEPAVECCAVWSSGISRNSAVPVAEGAVAEE